MDRDSASSLGIGLLVGAALGAAIGLLYAPQSGKETRQQIRAKTGEVVEKVKAKVGALRGNGAAEEEA